MSKLIQLKEILRLALSGPIRSPLPQNVIDSVGGYISPNGRHLLNRLGAISTSYYEVGTHRGASLISAAYGNNLVSAVGCDNWSQFNEDTKAREDCVRSCERFLPGKYKLLEKDCFTVTDANLPVPLDLFYSDGNHSFEAQRMAIVYNAGFMDDECIVVVDDFWWDEPNSGTMRGFKDSGVDLVFLSTLFSGMESDCGSRGFWNGMGVFLVRK